MSRRRRSPLPPYLKWRDGRPRWEPGPGLRRAGFKGRDLKDDRGQWLDIGSAIAAARKLNAQIPAGATPPPKRATKKARTCRSLYELWASPDNPKQASPAWQDLVPGTQRDYRNKIEIFLAEFGDERVEALSKSVLHDWWEDLFRERGHAMANSVLAISRAMLSYGELKGWLTVNPAKSLGLKRVPPRIVVWTPAEIEHIVAIADKTGYAGVGDAIVIALHTGQRQGDVLQLAHERTTGDRARFRQSKTDARISVPFTPALAQRLSEITTRRRSGSIAEIHLTGQLVRDPNGERYLSDRFRKDFRIVRTAAIKAAGDDQELAGLASRQFLDLRDTAVTRLALASCTIAEIRAITGHSLETIHQVLKHYLALDDRMADNAIARLKAWMEQEGIAI